MDGEFRSNDGRGPLRARVLHDDGDTVTLERWDERVPGSRRVRFQLKKWFMASASSGWRRVVRAVRDTGHGR